MNSPIHFRKIRFSYSYPQLRHIKEYESSKSIFPHFQQVSMITTFLPTWKNSYVTCEGRALCTSLHLNRILDKILWYTGMIIIRYTSLKKDTLLISNLFQRSFHVFQMPYNNFTLLYNKRSYDIFEISYALLQSTNLK